MYVFLVSVQYTLATECFQLGYNAEGHCKGEVDASLAEPQKLDWEIPSEVCFHSQVLHSSIKFKGVLLRARKCLVCFREDGARLSYIAHWQWCFFPQCEEQISQSLEAAQALANDVDMHVVVFRDFGKAKVKKCRVNPDAFIQIALQLAYYRVISPLEQNKLNLYSLHVQKGILL